MKSLIEIQEKLISELNKSIPRLEKTTSRMDYYNEIMGNTSFLLVGLLGLYLKDEFEDWHSEKWMDDSLITKVFLNEDKMMISGIAIWGIEDDTAQWTEPFYFEIGLKKGVIDDANYTFLFGDRDTDEISYEEFRDNRTFWNEEDRNWKYSVEVRNGKVS